MSEHIVRERPLHTSRLRSHAYRGRHARRGIAALAATSMCAAGLAGAALIGAASVASAATTGTVAGTVFEDYNANGTQNPGSNVAAAASATDVGVAGATVRVTDATGAQVGSGSSAANGGFSINVTAATTKVRVEIIPPAGYTAGPHGADSASTVQFVTLQTPGAGAVDVGLVRQGDYSQDAPPMLNVEQVSAIDSTPGRNLVDQSTKATVVSSAYTDRGTTATTTEALASQTGTVWGLAQLGGRYAFTGQFFKRHAPTGPGGMGRIYLTDLAQGPNATGWVTIPNSGVNPRGDESTMTKDDWFHDINAFPQVGKIGLGGMALAPDNSALYVMNLNDKSLYRVPVTLAGGTPVAGTPTSLGMPSAPGCAAGYVRPFGVAAQNGAMWVTLTCTGPTTSDLRGYVYRYDLSSNSFDATPAFQMDLTGYARGFAYTGSCPSSCAATWNAWPLDDTTFPPPGSGSNLRAVNAEPLLSDVGFDSNGDMTIGIKDRFADQVGYEAGNLTPGDGSTYEGFAAGDVLRACGDSQLGWTLESNATCGSRVGSNAGNSQGPGGGEFYNDDFGSTHNQVSLGGLLQLPGYGQIVDTTFDPGPEVRASGVRFFSNVNGANADHHTLLNTVSTNGTGPQGSFAKAGGLGDVAALVTAAPIEIGNRVWLDSNFDGRQTAGEAAIAGVTVHLYAADGSTLLATAVTDASGNYYFSNGPGTSTSSARYNVNALLSNTDYIVKLDNSADYAGAGSLASYTATTTAAGNDTAVDSNGDMTAGADSAPLTTGDDGTNDHTIDFGFTPPTYAVGDFVWRDLNENGIQDAGEAGVPGVTASLLDSSGNPAQHPDGTPVTAVQTDAAGHYVFDFLAAASYQVQFSTLPTGYVLTTQSAAGSSANDDSNPAVGTALTPLFAVGAVGSAPNMRAVNPADQVEVAVAINPTIDAGIVATASVSVGDFVWVDNNHNGLQDAGEPGISGVTVTLTGNGGGTVTDIFGNPVGPTVTDDAGAYTFADLPLLPGEQSYTVHVNNSQPVLAGAGYVPTLAGVGADRAQDSSTSLAASGDLTTDGASDMTLDFGFIRPAVSVGDFVWEDSNGNGVQNDGEPGLQGVVVTITQTNGAPVTDVNGIPMSSRTTDSLGFYSFTNLPALPAGQHYTTHVDNTQPALTGYTSAQTGQGTASTDSSDGAATSSNLTADGDTDMTLDFGFVQPVSVGDFVWEDTNHDGLQDFGEPGIPGVTLTISNADGGPVRNVDGTPVAATTTTTLANGGYDFGGLAPGRYTVTITPPAGYVATTPLVGADRAVDSSTGSATSGTLAGGTSDVTLDFGLVRPVSVGDFVWNDRNRNGIQDAGELGIEGVTVTLTGPDGNAVTDINGNLVNPATTNNNGGYTFDNLPVLAAGESYTAHVDNSQAALAGYLPTLAGAGSDAAKDSSTSSAASSDLTASGASDTSLDFGFFRSGVTVGDFVWVDSNGNGVQNAGEPGIPGVIVTLTTSGGAPVIDIDGLPVLPTTTDGDGLYFFADLPALPAGQHYVTHVENTQPALVGYTPTQTGKGTRSTDSSDGAAESGDLTNDGDSDLRLDFGFVRPVSVGDFVWEDDNHNGIQNAGEPGIAGVTLTIATKSGAPVLNVDGSAAVITTITDADGRYDFTGLAPGQYTVSVVAPEGFVATIPGAGSNRGKDSSTGNATSVPLAGGARDLTLDFGFVRPVSVGDFVWVDTNHNGVQDDGEPGITGVAVTITDIAGNPIEDLNGDIVGKQVTDSSGMYEFSNLPPGQYVTHIDATQAALSTYTPTAAGKGADRATDSSTDAAASTVLTSGQQDLTLDFGFVLTPADDDSDNAGGGADNGLANTGVPIDQLVWLALIVLLAGIGLLRAVRRRRA